MSEDNEPAPKSFNQFFGSLAAGEAHEDASEELQQLVAVLRSRAQVERKTAKGELTVKITFAVDELEKVGITYQVTTKVPPKKRPTDLRFATPEGHLITTNPRQVAFQYGELREVPGDAPPVQDYDPDTGEVR